MRHLLRKKVIWCIISYITLISVSVITKILFGYYNIEIVKPSSFLFIWTINGFFIVMFFYLLLNIFKEKLGKLFVFLCCFIFIIWGSGFLTIFSMLL